MNDTAISRRCGTKVHKKAISITHYYKVSSLFYSKQAIKELADVFRASASMISLMSQRLLQAVHVVAQRLVFGVVLQPLLVVGLSTCLVTLGEIVGSEVA